ncbi:ABC transporter permease [bacterium]|nr:ABC transporter permease [bacterium]
MMGRVFHVMKKEFIQTFRDPRMVVMIFLAPLLQSFIFGYAVTTDVKNINLVVLDHSRTSESRRLVQDFTASGYFTHAGLMDSEDELRFALERNRADAAIVIPPDFHRAKAGRAEKLQIVLDATDSNFAQVAAGYTQRILERRARDELAGIVALASARAAARGVPPPSVPRVEAATRIWYNPELRSVYYMVPGVICMILMIITMILAGLAVTRERELGTIEQIVISPITGTQFILGKLLPFAILGFLDVLLIIALATLHFEVPIRGSLVFLFGASGVFLFTTLGLGLFFSTISQTQQQAMFANFIFLMPAILLSGFMFPIENMPDAVQLLTYVNPLRYFLVIIRGVFLKGLGFDVLYPEVAKLALLGVVIFTLSAARFRRMMA